MDYVNQNKCNKCLSFSGSDGIVIVIIITIGGGVLCHYHHHFIFAPVCHNFYLSYLTVVILILISYSGFFTA